MVICLHNSQLRGDPLAELAMALPQRRGKAPASMKSGRAAQPRSQLVPAGVRKGVAKPAKRKPVSLKNQIRGLERLLRKVCSCIAVIICLTLREYGLAGRTPTGTARA